MSDADSVFSETAKGATKGALEFGEEKIKSLVAKFLQGKLGFIEDEETIQIVKAQRNKPEWKLYQQYIPDSNLRMQIEMGFSLRQLEGDIRRLHNLRSKILKKYTRKGLHVAELAQSGVISRYFGLLLGRMEDESELKEGIEEVLKDVDKYVIFLKSEDDAGYIAQVVMDKIRVLSPRAIIIFSCSSAVVKKAKKIVEEVKKSVRGYAFEAQVEDVRCRRYDFILRYPVDYLPLGIK